MEPQLDGDSNGWCVSHPFAFGILDISWQSLRHLSALYANSILGVKPFSIAFSLLGVLLALLHANLRERLWPL